MQLVNYPELLQQSNRLSLHLTHFAFGSFPCGNDSTSYSTNRLLFIRENPGGTRNYIEDSNCRQLLQPGCGYFVPCFHPVIFQLDDALKFISLHFNLKYFHGPDLFSGLNDIAIISDAELLRQFATITMAEASVGTALQLQTLALSAIQRLLPKSKSDGIEEIRKLMPYKKILDYLEKNCNAKVRIDFLAQMMHLSREGFSRKFSADVNLSPKRFLERQLVGKAAELLCRPKSSVREIACELKFSSEYAFSRFFKKMMGIAPSQYQKQHGA